jgi:hypothetical protein
MVPALRTRRRGATRWLPSIIRLASFRPARAGADVRTDRIEKGRGAAGLLCLSSSTCLNELQALRRDNKAAQNLFGIPHRYKPFLNRRFDIAKSRGSQDLLERRKFCLSQRIREELSHPANMPLWRPSSLSPATIKMTHYQHASDCRRIAANTIAEQPDRTLTRLRSLGTGPFHHFIK